MTTLRRKTTPRSIGMPTLIPTNICDICNRPRSSGDNTYKHTKCSKIRQARYAAIKQEKK